MVLDRAGYRVAKRRRCLAKVGVQHRVTRDDAIKWFQTKFEGVPPSVHVRGESINETCRQVDMQCSCHKLARCKSGFRPHYGGLRYWLVPRTASFSCLVAPSVQESTGFLRSMCRR